jgi:hypothetical protein
MNKRVVLTITGLAVVVAVVWLTTRVDERAGTDRPPSASPAIASPPAPTEEPGAADGSRAASSTIRPGVTGDAPAMQSEMNSPSQAPSATFPIDVSPGFEYLSKPAAEMKDTDGGWPQWRRHQQLQSEPRDEAWAPSTEAALRSSIQNALTARGVDTQRIELPVVECRTNGCEIQAVGYPEDNGKPGLDLQLIMFSLLKGSLGNEFDLNGLNMGMSVRADQRLLFLVLLPRKLD